MKTALETVPHTRRHKPFVQGAGPLPVELLEKVEAGGRLDLEEAVRLYGSDDLLLLGQMANTVKERKSGNKVYYIVNRHVNYTNVCKNRCRFCAFSKEENQAGGHRGSPSGRSPPPTGSGLLSKDAESSSREVPKCAPPGLYRRGGSPYSPEGGPLCKRYP